MRHPQAYLGIIAVFTIGVAAVLAPSSAFASVVTTTFDHGAMGWKAELGGGGTSYVDTTMGHEAPSYRIDYSGWGIFGIELTNDSEPGFIGDYTATPRVEISLDTYVTKLEYFAPLPRTLIVELRDYDDAVEPYGWTSVWAEIGLLEGFDHNWRTWSVTIEDTSSTEIPEGWYPYGDEDPETFEYILPEGRTFENVLAGVDEIVFSTFVPGYFYTDAFYDVSFDNISVAHVPEPTTAMLLVSGFMAILIRRR